MSTAQEIKDIIARNRSDIYKKDYTFFEVDTFAKCVDYVEKESATCAHCTELLSDMVNLAECYPKMLNNGSSGRTEFQQRLSVYTTHLATVHGYKRKGLFMPLYTMGGLAFGTIVGLISGQWLICLALGMIIGYIIGSTLDRKVVRTGKTF